MPFEPNSKPLATFTTSLGLYQFTVLPFGLHEAPASFQWLIDQVLQGCKEWAAAYLADVFIYSYNT